MSDNLMITIVLGLVAALFGLLMLLLGWLGDKLYTQIEQLGRAITVLAGELHSKINIIDGRLIRVEARYEICETPNAHFNRRDADPKE